MKKLALLISVSILLFSGTLRTLADDVVFPGESWERIDPISKGWSRSGLRKAEDYFREVASSALVIVQDGRVIAEWGDVERPIQIASVRKSFMSALYGIAVARNQIDPDATIARLNIDDIPPGLTDSERQATVRDLLKARSGIYHQAAFETSAMKERRPGRGSHLHGAFWYYNNWDFNALGTILRTATGQDTFAAVEAEIAQKIGMEKFRASDGKYVFSRVSQHPAYTMRFTARDLARFGWLYLNRGRWRENQIIPESWVAESTTAWTSNARGGMAYGYMWWVSESRKQFGAQVGPGSYSARGEGGQIVVIAPASKIVVVHLNDRSENEPLERGTNNNLMKLIFDAAPSQPK